MSPEFCKQYTVYKNKSTIGNFVFLLLSPFLQSPSCWDSTLPPTPTPLLLFCWDYRFAAGTTVCEVKIRLKVVAFYSCFILKINSYIYYVFNIYIIFLGDSSLEFCLFGLGKHLYPAKNFTDHIT